MRRYSSFVVRRWRLEDTAERVTIEHMQSGKRTTVDGLPQALAWMTRVDTEEEGGEGLNGGSREEESARE
ncbi:MAG: hypothetical protein NTZ05_02840 [Chloroflexi bacterium]|nr:hypothetical protein [Chloroflexota bacterium]